MVLKSIPGGDLDGRKSRLDAMTEKKLKKKPIKSTHIEQPPAVEHTQLNPLGDSIMEVNEKQGVDAYMYQGDINLSDEQLKAMEDEDSDESAGRKKRQLSKVYSKWTNNKVYFKIDPSLSARKQAILATTHAQISAKTCVDFVNDASQPNVVSCNPGNGINMWKSVFSGSGCYSNIGMIGGVQDLSIGDGCEVIGTVAHEFTHALGSFHMHQRTDRDSWLSIDLTNVDSTKQSNFIITTSAETINFTPYEYGSMMQYSASSFTTGGQISMNPTNADYLYTMGNRMISYYDIYMINAHYGCNALCPAGSAACVNGGTPNPRNCATCNCPIGYSGALCDQQPTANGGAKFTATTDWQKYAVSIGDSSSTDVSAIRDDYMMRIDWISAPAGKTIQVAITGTLFNPQCQYGCPFNGVQFKVDADQKANGIKNGLCFKEKQCPKMVKFDEIEKNQQDLMGFYRKCVCCDTFLNKTFDSALNPTPVITFNRYYLIQTSIMYRYVDGTTTTAPQTTTASGTWSAWTNGTCSDTCGMFGTATNTRTCQPAGATCDGAASESLACPINSCPMPRAACITGYKKILNSATRAIECIPV